MSATALGRRYERLLFLAAPILVAALFLLFVAYADFSQKERVTARCYDVAATGIIREASQSSSSLQIAWSAVQPISKAPYWGTTYKSAILNLALEAMPISCYGTVREAVDERLRLPPVELGQSLRKDAQALIKGPLALGGIQIPDSSTPVFLGIAVKADTMTLARALQVVLGPVMLVWLGSLYNTRFRETNLISQARLITDIFPHLVNVYPALPQPTIRKYSWLTKGAHNSNQNIAGLYAAVRAFLMLLVVGPAVATYLLSIVLMSDQAYNFLLYGLGGAVAAFAFTATVVEFQPWHVAKVFPGHRKADSGA